MPFDVPAGKFYGIKQPSSVIYALNPANSNVWYNLVYTLDATTKISKFYINNNIQGELTNDTYMPLATQLLVGYHNSYDWGLGWYMNGMIDDIRIYNRAITEIEIKQLYNEGGYPNTMVTDVDGNSYNTVKIGTQVWMKENLKTTKYNDGTPIPNITDNTAWTALTTGAYSDYNNTPANSTTYGRLYNWFTVDNNAGTKVASNGGKNVCPTGWHVPSDTEWTTLTDYLTNNGYGYEGSGNDIAKSMAATSGWSSFGTIGTIGNNPGSNNSSSFTALPGGSRWTSGTFHYIGDDGDWWSSSVSSASIASIRGMHFYGADVIKGVAGNNEGMSVRCLRD
jgi:uncharacterized protein (TIGR02145 family)